jgi:hypothetical protein
MDQTAPSHEINPVAPGFHEYRAPIATFAALICGALVLLWVSRGTQFHQLAIGIVMSSATLALLLALFELCWRVGLNLARAFGDDP